MVKVKLAHINMASDFPFSFFFFKTAVIKHFYIIFGMENVNFSVCCA